MATVTSTKRHLDVTSDTYQSNGNVVIGGDLTVNGSTTTLDTQNLIVEDKNIIIGQVSTPSDTTADGGGITLKGATDKTIYWNNSDDEWKFNQGIEITSGIITVPGGTSTQWNTAYGWGDHSGLYAAASHNHDDRYYTETESDNRFVNVTGDTMTGDLSLGSNVLTAGQILLPSYTASPANPTISFDSNTGGIWYESSGDVLHFRAASGNRAYINSSGITSASNVYTGTSGQFRNYAGVWKATTGTAGGDAQFILNGKTIMHIDEADERVGIGTTNPSEELHISSGNPGIRLQDSDGTDTFGRVHFTNTNLQFYSRNGTSNGVFSWYGSNGTADTEFMRISSAGYVGIGEANPNSKLVVDGGTENLIAVFRSTDDVAQIEISDDDTTTYLGSKNGVGYISPTAGTPADGLVVSSSGNVGIGEINPSATLHISDAANSSTTSFSANGRITMTGDGVLNWGSSAQYGQLTWDTNKAIVKAKSGAALHLGAANNSNHMVIDTLGNVGIGTTSPNHKLDIYSNENVPLRIHRPSNANLDSSGAWGIGFSTRSDAATSTTDTRAGIFSYYNGDLFLAANNSSIVSDPDAYARLTVLSTGNVGIGTISPKQLFHVHGGSTAGSVTKAVIGGTGGNGESYLYLAEHFSGDNVNYGFSFVADGNSSNNLLIKRHSNSTSGNTVITVNRDNDNVTFAGDVGIGVSPSQPLDVNGTALIRNTIYVGDDIQHWGDGGTGMYFGTDTISLKNDGGSTRLFVESGGDVGIGTTSPESKLHLYEASASPTLLTLHNYQSDINPNGSQGNFIDFKMTDDNATFTPQVRIGMIVKDTDGDGGIPSEGTGNFVVYTAEGTDSSGNGVLTEHFRITDKGDVGIGATSPDAKLHVVDSNNMPIIESTTSGNSARLSLKTTAREWRIGNAGSNSDFWIYDATAASYRLTIDTNGNVDITNDVTVGGTLTAANLTIGSGNKIKFANNDYIRYDDANGAGRFHFDADGGTNNASVQAATFVGALSTTGISGSNYNITGVNQLEINDPGEGIIWKGGSSGDITLAVVDDASDNILRLSGTGATLQVGTNRVLTTADEGSGNGLDADLLDGQQGSYYLAWSNLTGVPSTFTPSAHTHAASDITSGTFADARIALTNITQHTDPKYLRSDVADTAAGLITFTSGATFGSGVTLTESTDRADLLYINSSTSGWGGLQIGNTANEFIFSLMGDGNLGGIYDDLNSDWIIAWDENGESRLYHNGNEKLNTSSAGVTVTGVVTATGGTSTEWNTAYDNSIVSAAVTGTSTKTLTLNQQDGGTVTATWTDANSGVTGSGATNYLTYWDSASTIDDTNISYTVNGGLSIDNSSVATRAYNLTHTGEDTYSLRHGGANGGFSVYNTTDVRNEMLFDGDGNIGIGTVAPSTKLTINGITTSKGFQTDTANTDYSLLSRNNAGNATLYVQAVTSTTDQPIAQFNYGSASANNGTQVLKVAKDNSYFVNTNVGIKTTSPAYPLDVTGNVRFTGDLIVQGGQIDTANVQARVKYSVWSGTTYGIGMQNNYNYGHLNNDYAMTFQMNSDDDRGFWWGDNSHTNSQGAMSLSTNGKATIATSLSVGEGESITSPSDKTLHVDGETETTNLSYPYPTATNQFHGEIVTFGSFNTANGTIGAGDVIVYTTAGLNTGWFLAQGNTTYSQGMLGIAMGTSASDGILIKGFARNAAFTSGFLGSPLFLSPTSAGDTTNVVPSSTNNIVRIVGYMLNPTNDEIFFDPDKSWVQVS